MKEILLKIHPDHDKLKKDVIELISKYPVSTNGTCTIPFDELVDVCLGFYLKGFNLGVFETQKAIANHPDTGDTLQFHLDLPI